MEEIKLNINISGNADDGLKELKNSLSELKISMSGANKEFIQSFQTLNNEIKNVSNSFKITLLNNVKEAVSGLATPFVDATKQFYEFDRAVRDLSAVTGVSGEGLEKLKNNAKDLAVELGAKPTDVLKAFELQLSQLTPELAKAPDLLKMMGRDGILLGKAMGGDTVGAIKALNTAMNQYGIDLKDPVKAQQEYNKMMDIMTVSSAIGSESVTSVADGISKVGAIANSSGLSFEELNAALQVLGQKSTLTFAEGGVAFRNFLNIMQKGEYLQPKHKKLLEGMFNVDVKMLSNPLVNIKDKLIELRKVTDMNLLGDIFGENKAAAMAMINHQDLFNEFTKTIVEQQKGANKKWTDVQMEGLAEQRARIMAFFENVKITAFEAMGPMALYAELSVSGLMSLISLAPGIVALQSIFTSLAGVIKLQSIWTGIATAATWLWNAALWASPIMVVVGGILAAYAAFKLVQNVVVEVINNIGNLWATFTEKGPIEAIKQLGQILWDAITAPFIAAYEWVAKLFGLADSQDKKGPPVLDIPDQTKEEAKKTVTPESKSIIPTANQLITGKTTAPTTNNLTAQSEAKASVKQIDIRIDSLVKNMNISSANLPDFKSQIKDAVNEALIAAVRDTEVGIS